MPDKHEIRSLAQNLLRGGTIGSALIVASGRIGIPLKVHAPDGRHHSWFVPVTIDSQLAGFFQFLPDGTFMRFSSFQRQAGDLAGCPAAADWLDLHRIQAHAEVQRKSGETSSEPFLTYDRSPDRIVWAVPLADDQGRVRHVYVAGKTVYMPPSEGTYG